MKNGIKILLSVILSVFFLSCTDVEDEIVGTWNLMDFGDERLRNMTWEFTDDGHLIRRADQDGEVHIDSCTYEVDQSTFRKEIFVEGSTRISVLGTDTINGRFSVDELTDRVLILTRIEMTDGSTDGSYLRREFIRN